MYQIEARPFGFQLTFGGIIDRAEMSKWLDDSRRALGGAPRTFGVVIDMRTLAPLAPDVQSIMVEGQKAFLAAGMQRSCVILASKITAMQFRRLAHDSGIDAFERYLDAQSTPDWSRVAVAWVKDGVDPEKADARPRVAATA